MNNEDFSKFAKGIISDKQYTEESILNYIKDPDGVKYPNEKIIPIYPTNPYDWIDKVKLSGHNQSDEIRSGKE